MREEHCGIIYKMNKVYDLRRSLLWNERVGGVREQDLGEHKFRLSKINNCDHSWIRNVCDYLNIRYEPQIGDGSYLDMITFLYHFWFMVLNAFEKSRKNGKQRFRNVNWARSKNSNNAFDVLEFFFLKPNLPSTKKLFFKWERFSRKSLSVTGERETRLDCTNNWRGGRFGLLILHWRVGLHQFKWFPLLQ